AFTRELEQVRHDDGCGRHLALRCRQVALRGVTRMRSEVTAQQIHRVTDHTERVTQLMADSRGKLTDGSEPLLPHELLVRGSKVGKRRPQLFRAGVNQVVGVLPASYESLDDAGGEDC